MIHTTTEGEVTVHQYKVQDEEGKYLLNLYDYQNAVALAKDLTKRTKKPHHVYGYDDVTLRYVLLYSAY